jgi:hypothetical protein
MQVKPVRGEPASPTRLLEILADRFGAFEALAASSIALSRVGPDEERPMEPLVAEAVLEFGEDLREARHAAAEWCGTRTRR